MPANHESLIPGNRKVFTFSYSSQASNATDGAIVEGAFIAPQKCEVLAAKFVPRSDQVGSATNYRNLEVVKVPTGTPTVRTSVATYTLESTDKNVDAQVETDMTLSTTAANVAMATGDMLCMRTNKAGNGIALVAGDWQVEVRLLSDA